MKTLTTILFISAVTNLFGQIAHDLEIYSDDGSKFTLFMNGEQVNATPQSKVKVENTHADFAEVKVDFEDASKKDIVKNHLMICRGGQVQSSVPALSVYKIVSSKNKLKVVSRSSKKLQRQIIPVEYEERNPGSDR